jgi:hypothetical protein
LTTCKRALSFVVPSPCAQLATHKLYSPDFEKHTKGVGSKLLNKMGNNSGGLREYGQGIITPIDPKRRPVRENLGYVEITLPNVCSLVSAALQEPELAQQNLEVPSELIE